MKSKKKENTIKIKKGDIVYRSDIKKYQRLDENDTLFTIPTSKADKKFEKLGYFVCRTTNEDELFYKYGKDGEYIDPLTNDKIKTNIRIYICADENGNIVYSKDVFSLFHPTRIFCHEITLEEDEAIHEVIKEIKKGLK